MKIAIGIVMNTVKAPQGLVFKELTITMDKPAMVISRMKSTAREAAAPVTGPISFLAI